MLIPLQLRETGHTVIQGIDFVVAHIQDVETRWQVRQIAQRGDAIIAQQQLLQSTIAQSVLKP
jgi:hypothetical protein